MYPIPAPGDETGRLYLYLPELLPGAHDEIVAVVLPRKGLATLNPKLSAFRMKAISASSPCFLAP
jgi:hypothetical protein